MNPDRGYSIHEPLFMRREMSVIVEAMASAEIHRTRAGARHVLAVPAVRALAGDARLAQIASSYLDASAFPFRATLFDKSLQTNWLVSWHQDTALPLRQKVTNPAWGPWSHKGGVLHACAPAAALEQIIALRVHLDDSTADNGPLRVLPDTHADGVLSEQLIDDLATSRTAVECLVQSGGVVAMRPLIVHASSKARGVQPRRVLHIEFTATAMFDAGIELAVG